MSARFTRKELQAKHTAEAETLVKLEEMRVVTRSMRTAYTLEDRRATALQLAEFVRLADDIARELHAWTEA